MSLRRTGFVPSLVLVFAASVLVVTAGCDCGGCGKKKEKPSRLRADVSRPASSKPRQKVGRETDMASSTAATRPEKKKDDETGAQPTAEKRYELKKGTWIPIVGDVPIDEAKLPPKVKQPRQVYRTMVLLKKFQQTMPPPPQPPAKKSIPEEKLIRAKPGSKSNPLLKTKGPKPPSRGSNSH